eukprot:1142650-Pelagomonas_calceolata.AAC.3
MLVGAGATSIASGHSKVSLLLPEKDQGSRTTPDPLRTIWIKTIGTMCALQNVEKQFKLLQT